MESDIVYPPGCQHVEPSLNTSHLLNNLKVLADKLQSLEPAGANYPSLVGHLLQSAFIRHNAKEVKALAACCLADVLRLSAPNICVESETDLKELFSFFIRVLRSIEDVNNSNYKRYFYLLECLASSNSFLLLTRLECSETVITLTGKLFNLFFHVIKEEHVGKGRSLMLDIMACLLNEPVCVNNEILELIYQQMLPPFKHQRPFAYSLASELLRLSASNIENHVHAFFSEVFSRNEDLQMFNAKTNSSSSSNGSKLTLHRIYELLAEVYSSAPSTILSVLPQLEIRLKSPDVEERVLAVQCVGRMFGQEDITFINNLWPKFVSRTRDVSTRVRMAFLETVPGILSHQNEELGFDVRTSVCGLSRDLEEEVRTKVVTVVDKLAVMCFSSVDFELLEAMKGRLRDTSWAVRSAVMKCVASMYNMHCNKDTYEFGSKLWSKSAAFVKLSWVPDRVLQNYVSTSTDEKSLVEKLFCTKLVASAMDSDPDFEAAATSEQSKISTSKLVHIFCLIEENSVRILQEILKTGILLKYNFGAGEVETLVHKVVMLVKRPAESSLNNNFYTFDKINSDGSDVEPSNEDPNDVQVAFLSGKQDEKIRAAILVETIAFCYPKLFNSKTHFEVLLKLLNASVISEQIRLLVLKIFVALSKNAEITEISEELSDQCQQICLKTENPKVGKYCVILINIIRRDSEKRKNLFAELFNKLTDKIELNQPNILGVLGSLAQIGFIAACDLYKEFQTFIYNFLIMKLLSFHEENHVDLPTSLKDLEKEEYRSSCRIILAKAAGLKLINRWLLGLNGVSAQVTESKFRMLHSVISQNGDIADDNIEISELEKSVMKLTAFKMMLKLNIVPSYRDLMTEEQFHTMASVILDPNKEIRERVAIKLEKNLSHARVPLKFLAIFSFSARDPNDSLRLKHQSFIRRIVQKRRHFAKEKSKSTPDKSNATALARSLYELNPDNVMPFVVHLLAHFHEFDSIKNVKILQALKECLWYIMEVLMSDSEHFLYTFHKFMLDALKLSKDALDPENEEITHKIYAVCDLAITLLNSRVKVFDTTPSSELKLILPPKLFVQPDLTKGPNTKVYVDQSLLEKPKTMINSSGNRRNRRQEVTLSLKEMTNKPAKNKKAKPSVPKSQSKISDHVVTSLTSSSKKRRFVEADDTDDNSASFSPSVRRDSPDLKPQKTYPSRRSSAAATEKISKQSKIQSEDDEETENDSSDNENRFVLTRKADDMPSDSDRSPSVGSPKLSSTGNKQSTYSVSKSTSASKTPLRKLSLKNGNDPGQDSGATLTTVGASKAKKRLVMNSPLVNGNLTPEVIGIYKRKSSIVEQENKNQSPLSSVKPVEISSSPCSISSSPKRWNLRASGIEPVLVEESPIVHSSHKASKPANLNGSKSRDENTREPVQRLEPAKRSVVRIPSSTSSKRSELLSNAQVKAVESIPKGVAKKDSIGKVSTSKRSINKKDSIPSDNVTIVTPRRALRSTVTSEIADDVNDCVVLSSESSSSAIEPKRVNKKTKSGKKITSETETISSRTNSNIRSQRSTRSHPAIGSGPSEDSNDNKSDHFSSESGNTKKGQIHVRKSQARLKVVVVTGKKAVGSVGGKRGRSQSGSEVKTPKGERNGREKVGNRARARILDTPSSETSHSIGSETTGDGTPCSRTRSRVGAK